MKPFRGVIGTGTRGPKILSWWLAGLCPTLAEKCLCLCWLQYCRDTTPGDQMVKVKSYIQVLAYFFEEIPLPDGLLSQCNLTILHFFTNTLSGLQGKYPTFSHHVIPQWGRQKSFIVGAEVWG